MDNISQETIRKLIDIIFLHPQRILGGEEEGRKLDNVHLVFIKLLSGTPMRGRGCVIDPLLIKLGFSEIDEEDDICNLTEKDLNQILEVLKRQDENIGTWNIIHDIPASDTIPQWRLSAEISPLRIQSGKIEKTNEENSRKILCLNIEGVGIFMGNPKNS